MPQTNPLLRMIEANAVPLGMQCFTADHALIEVLGLTGFDFVMLDTEHSPANPRAIEDAIRATDGAGLVPLVRVPSTGKVSPSGFPAISTRSSSGQRLPMG